MSDAVAELLTQVERRLDALNDAMTATRVEWARMHAEFMQEMAETRRIILERIDRLEADLTARRRPAAAGFRVVRHASGSEQDVQERIEEQERRLISIMELLEAVSTRLDELEQRRGGGLTH